jgi:hypothetical protein
VLPQNFSSFEMRQAYTANDLEIFFTVGYGAEFSAITYKINLSENFTFPFTGYILIVYIRPYFTFHAPHATKQTRILFFNLYRVHPVA